MEGGQFVNKNNSDAIFLTSNRIELEISLNPTHFLVQYLFLMVCLEIKNFYCLKCGLVSDFIPTL